MEAVVEALQLGDLLLRLLVLARQQVAGRLALAHVGGEVGADGRHLLVLQGQDARADALQQAPVVGHEDEGARVGEEVLLEPLDGVDVEVVGGLVEEEQVGGGEQAARQGGARELAAGQREQAALEERGRQAQPLDHALELGLVAVAAGELEAVLQLLIVAQRASSSRLPSGRLAS